MLPVSSEFSAPSAVLSPLSCRTTMRLNRRGAERNRKIFLRRRRCGSFSGLRWNGSRKHEKGGKCTKTSASSRLGGSLLFLPATKRGNRRVAEARRETENLSSSTPLWFVLRLALEWITKARKHEKGGKCTKTSAPSRLGGSLLFLPATKRGNRRVAEARRASTDCSRLSSRPRAGCRGRTTCALSRRRRPVRFP